jgi:signal transduction histidine kinase
VTTLRRRSGGTDLVLALGTGALTTAALIAAPALLAPSEAPTIGATAWWVTAAALWLQALVLVFASARPRGVLIAAAAVAAAVGLVAPAGIGNVADGAVIVAVIRAAAVVRTGTSAISLPVAALLVVIGQAADLVGSGQLPVAPAIGSGVLQSVVVVGLPAAAALAVTARRETQRARIGELAAMGREREALIRAAVAGERTAMARELHDIAAHHLSSMALMTAAIDRQIDVDPDAAKRGVRQVRAQSRAMLDDLRRLVGLLRDGATSGDAIETLDTVPELVATARAAGRSVELRRLDADVPGVGPLAQLVAHRMVQESLANAATHAPGSACVVELDGREEDRYLVVVHNEPARAPASTSVGGFGLVGMRERADLVGATLSAGADEDGGWTVRLALPRERALEVSP